MAKKLQYKFLQFKYLNIYKPDTLVIKNPSNGMVDDTMRWIKKEALANLHLLKIHFLLLKLVVIKEFSSLMMKIFR
jgi:hypothetical protein